MKSIFNFIRKYKDPVKHCIIYKNEGCSHVYGFLCDFDTCKERKEAELFELGQQLDIPIKDRIL